MVNQVDERDVTIPVGDGSVSGLWRRPPDARALAVVAHGAGNSMRHPYFDGIVDGLARSDVAALRFDFPYVEAGRRAPDRAPVLMEAWRAALGVARTLAGDAPLVATGKSLGGRMASTVAAEDGDAFAARALVFFGYPLHAPGKADQPRDGHLASITVPMLFIEGTRDPFARYDLVEAVVEGLGPRARLHAVEGGDHSHRVRGTKRSDREIGEDLGSVASAFISEVVG